nr:MAG TPA: hypothetical protein [Caudoviricetes sp.]
MDGGGVNEAPTHSILDSHIVIIAHLGVWMGAYAFFHA